MSVEARNAHERAKQVRQRLEQAIAEQKLPEGRWSSVTDCRSDGQTF
jgi:hypothetical protein